MHCGNCAVVWTNVNWESNGLSVRCMLSPEIRLQVIFTATLVDAIVRARCSELNELREDDLTISTGALLVNYSGVMHVSLKTSFKDTKLLLSHTGWKNEENLERIAM